MCTLINGRAYKKDELLSEGEYPVLRVGNFFTNDHWYYSDLKLDEHKYCDNGDLLYAWSASFGPRIWEGNKVIYHYHIWKVLPKTDIVDKRFLFHLLGWDVEQIKKAHGTGTTMMHVSKGSMEGRIVPVPPLPEQHRIVSILDEAFEGIDTAVANAEQNLVNAREVFESYLNSVFVNKGSGWNEKQLGEMATFRNGINFTKSSKGVRVKIVGVSNFQNYFWAPLDDLDSVITEGNLPDYDLLNKNDLLFVRSNGNLELIGRCVLVGEISEKITHSGFTIRARLNDNNLSAKYLCHFLKTKPTRKKMVDGGTGTNIKSLNQTILSNLVVPYPSLNQQADIVSKIDDLSAETQQLESIYQQKLTALDELKKSILHQAFSGQLN